MSALSGIAKHLLNHSIKWQPAVRESLELAAQNGLKNGNGNGNGMAKSIRELNAFGAFGEFGSNRVVYNKPPKLEGSLEHAHAIIDSKLSSQYREYEVDYYTKDDRFVRFKNKGYSRNGKPQTRVDDILKANSRADQSNPVRAKRIAEQTLDSINPKKFNENPQLSAQKRRELNESHHLLSLEKMDFLFTGRSKAEQQKILQHLEDVYMIGMGNSQFNAMQLPTEVHRLVHKSLDDLDIHKADIKNLSFDELTPTFEKLKEYMLREQEMIYSLMN
jgi:hypothetical protein